MSDGPAYPRLLRQRPIAILIVCFLARITTVVPFVLPGQQYLYDNLEQVPWQFNEHPSIEDPFSEDEEINRVAEEEAVYPKKDVDVTEEPTFQPEKMLNPVKPSNAKISSHGVQFNAQPLLHQNRDSNKIVSGMSDFTFIAIVSAFASAAVFAIVGAGVCFYRLQKNSKAAAETEYPAYGVTGPNKDNTSPSGDRKLAQSAQMYHYQHQKQQMIALEKAGTERNQSASDVDSEEENEEGDYTVYECPGLAPTGEMEVKNPLFSEQPTPTSPSTKKKNSVSETIPEKESTKM